jgi:MoxR-like ATPase
MAEAAQVISKQIIHNIEKVIVGRARTVELAVIAIIAEGHLLIQDAPGVGKTMLARSLAKSINCSFQRIQFTPDMLPSDITGVTIYNQKTGDFEFRAGPIMAQVVLADEINRATPKVQSALLECMEENQVTVDGTTHLLPSPFHVVATQNPLEYEGIFPLPETQLDRFLLRIHLGYPSLSEEVTIMENLKYRHPITHLDAVAGVAELLEIQRAVKSVYVDDLVKEYIATIVDATRHHTQIYLGASPRGSLALFRAAQAQALIRGREFVLPDDVKDLVGPVLSHRIVPQSISDSRDSVVQTCLTEIVQKIPVPGFLLS